MSNYSKELHEKYILTIDSFLSSYVVKDVELNKKIDSFCRICALNIFSKNNVDIKTCADAINAIYSNELNKTEYTIDQVSESIELIKNKKANIVLPEFFKNMVQWDAKYRKNFSIKFTNGFKYILLFFAMVDNEIAMEEAKMVTEICNILYDYCNEYGIDDEIEDVNDVFKYVKNKKNSKEIYDKKKTIVSENKNESENDESNKALEKDLKELNKLIGLKEVKNEVNAIVNFIRIQEMRKQQGLPTTTVSYHLVFTGNPGTGKTTVARIIAKIYKDLGILSKGQLVEVDRSGLVAGYVGQTAIKTQEIIQKAIGGVLFIDEAYTLATGDGQDFGQESIDTLLKAMEEYRNDLVVIVAGYDDLMERFINSNPGLKSRFSRYIHFANYNGSELYEIFRLLCTNSKYVLEENVLEPLKKFFQNMSENTSKNFGNARDVRNYFETVLANQANRLSYEKDVKSDDLVRFRIDDFDFIDGKDDSIEKALEDLNKLIGLDSVKKEINDLIKLVENYKVRKEKGLNISPVSLHLVFTGNPGTGKTTVARIIGRIYKCLGLLSEGKTIETDRSDLVAGYVGQTAIKTQNVIDRALGGVLFIDEAYTLSKNSDSDFGQEAIDTLLKAMEDNRNNLVVIVAGYDDLMENFINSNPGLKSRFNRYIHFDDYSNDDLVKIFALNCKSNQYDISDEAKNILSEYFKIIDKNNFGNGRGVRNIFEKVVTQQAKRLSYIENPSVEDLSMITSEDIEEAIYDK